MNLPEFKVDHHDAVWRAACAGVYRIVNVGTRLDSSRQAVKLADEHECLFATVGVHPHEASSCDAEVISELRRLCAHPKVVAIGEIGLDFYRDYSPRASQIDAFRRQIGLAREVSLPIVIHDREAHDEVLKILQEECADDMRVVLHCYSAGPLLLPDVVALGFFIGIDGPVTYTSADSLREVAAKVPLERLLLETDSPYLAPKGRPRDANEPAFLPDVAQKVAEARGVATSEVATATTRNALRVFRRLR